KIDEIKFKRLPNDLDQLRQRALYVDINDAGADWLRPCVLIQKSDARVAVSNAVNDYLPIRDRLISGIMETSERELASAFQAIGDHPGLPYSSKFLIDVS